MGSGLSILVGVLVFLALQVPPPPLNTRALYHPVPSISSPASGFAICKRMARPVTFVPQAVLSFSPPFCYKKLLKGGLMGGATGLKKGPRVVVGSRG